jgi:hypothetical protein
MSIRVIEISISRVMFAKYYRIIAVVLCRCVYADGISLAAISSRGRNNSVVPIRRMEVFPTTGDSWVHSLARTRNAAAGTLREEIYRLFANIVRKSICKYWATFAMSCLTYDKPRYVCSAASWKFKMKIVNVCHAVHTCVRVWNFIIFADRGRHEFHSRFIITIFSVLLCLRHR